ncbi:MAG TPA: DHA2 family efflux MFS transporter permease subunit [Candidatus Baltobacteraceae bacterium]|nr:DHA2 family efflux MFS transporter permease subunit [Candidatus Baltobacteraceae bacterium]
MSQPLNVVERGTRRVIVSLAVIAATLLEVIDTTIVNVALPNIQGNFGVAVDQAAWIVTGYIIANVVVLPITPWLAARFGRRQYFFVSIVIFTIASLMCGLAGSFGSLVFWRIVQGLGGGGLISTSQAILRDTYTIEEQGKAQGIFAMGVIVGPALGPVLGGWITDNFTWRWAFFINLPVGILAASLIWMYLRNPAEPQRKKLDWLGLGMLAAGLGSMQFVLDQGQQYDWFSDPKIVLFTALAAIGIGSFIWWTLRSAIPVVDLHVLRLRQVAAGSILGAVLGVSLYGSILVLPQYLQNSLGFSATLSGLTMLVRAGAIMLFTPVTAMLAGRGVIDVRISTAIGFVLLGVSNWVLADITTPQSDFGTFIVSLVIGGIGLSQIFVPLSIAVLGGVPDKDVPSTSAFFNLSRQVGGSIATAVLVTLLVRGASVHQTDLAASINLHRPSTTAYLQANGGQHSMPALANLQQIVANQALVQSYADTSRWVAIISVVLAPLVLLLNKPRLGGSIPAE